MLVLGCSKSELNSVCLVGFLSPLGRFHNFLRVSINHLYRLGKPNQPVHLVQFAGMAVWVVGFVCAGSWLLESELNSVCLVGFLRVLVRFPNFLRVSINHLDRLG